MQIQNLTLSTVEIAEMLDNTPHKDILKKLEGRNGRNGKHTKGYIEILTERQMSPSDFFFLSSYKDASGKENKVNLLVMATDDVVKKGVHAGNIVKAAAACCGGGGGGRPNMAQAGGKDVSKIEEALQKAKSLL